MGYQFGSGTTDRLTRAGSYTVSNVSRTVFARVRPASASSAVREILNLTETSGTFLYAVFFELSSAGTNVLRFGFSNQAAGAYPAVTWATGWTAGTDHIAIATYDGANLAIYADADATAKATLAETRTPDGSMNWIAVGNEFAASTKSWDGIIWEVAFWDGTALGSSDRAILQGGGSPGDCSVAPTMWWPFTADGTDAAGSFDLTPTGATFVSEDTETETLAPDAVLASSGLSGATLANIDDDPAASDGSWATATSNNVATSIRVSFPTPSAALSGDQTFRALVRKNSASGSGTPTATLSLYENGSLISADTAENVTSTTGQVISYTWSSAGRTASQIECLITGTASGGGPSVRASVDIGAVAWDATIEATGPSDETLNATPATITAQAQTATITAGSVTLTAAVATLTAQAQAATLTATAPLTITPAQITATAQTATLTPGAVSVSATPASVTAAAQSATVTAGSVTLEATPATVTSTAQAATLTASVTLDAGPATVTSTAQTATLTPGAVTLPATPAQITVTAQTASISTEAGPQDLEASPASITTSAQTAEISATVTLTAGPATITAEALTATTTPEIAVLEGGPANLTAQAQSVTLTPGSVTVEASPATVTAQAQTADVTAEAGDQTRNATPAEITATVPGAVLTAGAVTLTAGPATATVIGQTATITAGEGDQTVPAGPAGVTATAQTATISAGSVTIEASPATVTASAPVVEISAGVELSASPATALLVAAVAVLVAGAATIEGSPALITVSAQSATVTGGGTLPVVSSVAGGDRAAVTVAGGDRGMVAVVGRNRGMVAVAGGDQGATGVDSGDDRAVAVTGGDRRL